MRKRITIAAITATLLAGLGLGAAAASHTGTAGTAAISAGFPYHWNQAAGFPYRG